MAATPRTIFDAAYEAAMRRFLELPRRQQLRAYQDMRAYLGAGLPRKDDDLDRRLERQAESLAVLADVIEYRGIRDRPLKAKEFDETMEELGRADEWSSGKIIGIWRYWRFAVEALDGQPPSSPTLAAIRSHLGGRKRTRLEHLDSVRAWLATNPPKTTALAYEEWVVRMNATRGADDPVMPHPQTVKSALARGFPDIVSIARREETFESTRVTSVSRRADRTSGPDHLIALGTVARVLEVNKTTAWGRVSTDSFPPVALELEGVPVWVKEDVEAYAAGKRSGWRSRSLANRYYSAVEVSQLLLVRAQALSLSTVASPEPTGRAGGRRYWLRTVVQQWLRENGDVIERRRRKLERQGPVLSGRISIRGTKQPQVSQAAETA